MYRGLPMTSLRRETCIVAGILVSVASLFSASTALAATTWDFRTGASGITQTVVGGAWGNTRTFAIGSDSVTVTAWADDNPAPPMSFRTAHSGQYDTGLGICNRSEAVVAGSLPLCDQDGGVRDQVDNVGNNDFMLFIFSSPQTLESVTIDPYGAFDRDVSFWIGTVSGPVDLTNLTVSGLAGLGFGSQNDSFNGVGDPEHRPGQPRGQRDSHQRRVPPQRQRRQVQDPVDGHYADHEHRASARRVVAFRIDAWRARCRPLTDPEDRLTRLRSLRFPLISPAACR
jgi:hypothetical protein